MGRDSDGYRRFRIRRGAQGIEIPGKEQRRVCGCGMRDGGGVTGHAGQVGQSMAAMQAVMGPCCVTAVGIIAVTVVAQVMALGVVDAAIHGPRESRVQGGEDEQAE